MLLLALGAALLLAVGAQVAVALLRADAAALHYLAAGGIRQFPGDLDVQLEKPLERDVRWEGLHALRTNYYLSRLIGQVRPTPACIIYVSLLRGMGNLSLFRCRVCTFMELISRARRALENSNSLLRKCWFCGVWVFARGCLMRCRIVRSVIIRIVCLRVILCFVFLGDQYERVLVMLVQVFLYFY